MYFYVVLHHCKEIVLIDDNHQHITLHSQDIDRCCFLAGMCQTYSSLTSQDEPNISDINCHQKLELNQYIHFAQTNWDARQAWYHERRRSAVNKNSPFTFIPQPWKKIKTPMYQPDYINQIRNNINSKPKASASWPVHKNNWLHPDTQLFSKHHNGFGFLLVIK